MRLTPGTRLGAYEILSTLGAGGMGEVYRARDTRLGRDVALKVVPAELSASADRIARFEREARMVAALNHPNIVVLYAIEDDGGVRFLTMELVEGRSLADVIADGAMPIEQLVELGAALADALAAAHERGVVHRDLKPANLMLTKDGRLKVLDFGLAKLVTSDPGTDGNLTQAATVAGPVSIQGQVVGTVPYMAPEQIRGGAVDARTDLFALGIVLHEMATGTRPFGGATLADISSAILRDAPPRLGGVRAGLPLGLERIVWRCLEKEPGARFQSSAEVANALRELSREIARGEAAPAPGASAAADPLAETPEHSIAVLPFEDYSPARDQQYFSDGISEELLNLLARVPRLKVSARTSSFSFRSRGFAVPEIARQLNVRHVLEGSVRKAGDRVRISAQLIDAQQDTTLWSETYNRTLDDVFAIQDEIAADVVVKLKVRLLGGAPRVRETKPAAYALYLEAVQLSRQRTAEGFAKADELLRRVLAIDPQYAPAWAHLSNNLLNEANLGLVPHENGYAESRAAAARALETDPESARAHASLGTLDMFSGDLASSARHFERALAIDPNDMMVLGNSSAVLKSLGRLEDAVAMDEAMVRRDPMNTAWLFNLANAQNWAGQHDRAAASARAVLRISPAYNGAHLVLATALVRQGRPEDALPEARQESFEPFRLIALAIASHALGQRADSDTALAELITRHSREVPYDVACIYAFRGEADHAFEWLEKAAAAHDPSLVLVLVENLFAPLHSDPRWLPFLRRIGKDPETLAKVPFQAATPSWS